MRGEEIDCAGGAAAGDESSGECSTATAISGAPPLYSSIHAYATADYWEKRYTARVADETFDFYAELPLFQKPVPEAIQRLDARILHVGNGNSRLPESMYRLGYCNQTVSDISRTVMARMGARTADCGGLRWVVADATWMPEYDDSSFDVVCGKGTFDALGGTGQEHRLIGDCRGLARAETW